MYLLFTIPNCSICERNKGLLNYKNIEYKEIKVTESKENAELAEKYKVKMGGSIIDNITGKLVSINEL
jgi:glutaredoxin